MVVESGILCGNKSLHKIGREIAVGDADTVLAVEVPCSNHFAIGTVNLCGEAVDRILQVLNWRHISNPSVPDSREGHTTKDKHQ